MIKLNHLQLSETALRNTDRSVGILAANGGIDIEIVERDGQALVVVVAQRRLVSGIVWTQGELVQRGRDALRELSSSGYTLHFRASVFTPDLSGVNSQWIAEQMDRYGLKQRDVCKQLSLDKSTMSEFLSGRKALTKLHRSLFWHYFQLYKVSRDFLAFLNR